MSTFVIGIEESRKFACLSGDFNCQHLDEVQARRLPFGRTVVHGLHTLLCALDVFAQTRTSAFRLRKIRASFTGPVYQGDVAAVAIQENGDNITLTILSNGRTVSIINFSVQTVVSEQESRAGTAVYRFSPATLIDAQEILGYSGVEPLATDADIAKSLFPNLFSTFDKDQTSVLLASTNIVGMKCPGERSIFKYLSIAFSEEGNDRTLAYKVDRFEPISSMASISLSNDWVKGSIHAILRAIPVSQTSYEDVLQAIGTQEGRGRHVLIVGGTRGMGEIATKIAAASGADVTIGYALGRDDAIRVADEISAGGGNAMCCKIDVREEIFDIDAMKSPVTDMYYFASPKIIMNNKEYIDKELLRNYIDFYLFGLDFVIDILTKRELLAYNVNIFMPSSVFVDQPKDGAFEYAAAKSMAEIYLSYLSSKHGQRLSVTMPRLPMTRTDQTSNVEGHLPSAIDILLPLLSPLHAAM